ncbi:alkaline phosphatase [Brachybacterium sp. P6-10-X1]|uniref:alkaline phosphatase D family protein n=1 Tax=Brachybacterium sp. P6-10-X1 TaxID=1903186 RepID=UPI0009719B55|nr:alkaline phosphatase D family protein [Brachybacterium sp. P6-10-X1]APX32632.1 alkaline phosphatase [Brachybacterium sp. P6-10-X1]
MERSSSPNRRALLKGAAASALATSLPVAGAASAAPTRPSGPPTSRLTLPSGLQTGDVTSRSAVLWSRASGEGRLHAVLHALDAHGERLTGAGRGHGRGKGRGHDGHPISLRGPWATAETDYTARISAKGLPAGTTFETELFFEDENGRRSEVGTGRFSTAPGKRSDGAQTFVWTADTAGQGYGINPDVGGMFGYETMRALSPDFFLHAGDTIYADGPIAETLEEPDGAVWRNVVTDEVAKVAETLQEFRGRHRYNLLDENIRALYAEVPVIATWDDHETTNNWWAGEILEDEQYTVREVDTLAARGRRAWQENQPIADKRAMSQGSGFEPERIYRRIERGPDLDVFVLDMRTHKGENTDGLERQATAILGEEQLEWLLRGLRTSQATWKVILADLPLGIVVPDGEGQESISNAEHGAPLGRELELARLLSGIKHQGTRNVVFFTGDVHYCAAHHYSPERAAFTDFDPFWEFVAGPINAGSFGPNEMDQTFGPQVDFQKAGPAMGSPRDGQGQFFGRVEIAPQGEEFTVELIDANGDVQYTRTLTPDR